MWVGVGIEGGRVGDGCFRSQKGHVEWVGEKEDNLSVNQDDKHLIEKRLYKIKWEQERLEQEYGLMVGVEESGFDNKCQLYVNESAINSS